MTPLWESFLLKLGPCWDNVDPIVIDIGFILVHVGSILAAWDLGFDAQNEKLFNQMACEAKSSISVPNFIQNGSQNDGPSPQYS